MNTSNYPSLLFHRNVPWNCQVQGSTGILASYFLNAGYPVAWMTRLRHAGHLCRGDRRPIATRASDGVLVLSPISIFPRLLHPTIPPRMYAWISQAAYGSMRPTLSAILARAGQPDPEVIWTCGGDGGVFRRLFPRAVRIVQCVDLYEAIAGSNQNHLEELDYASADMVVSTGHALARFLTERRGVSAERIRVIGQGVDLDRFRSDLPEPKELAATSRPRLIWVGVLAKADPALIQAVLDTMPDRRGTLILIGPKAPWALRMASQDRRVLLVGPRSTSETAAWMMHCDVGLMLYDRGVNPLKYLGQNPLKLYEYAAAGLAIWSTPHVEYEYLRPPVCIVREAADVKSAWTRLYAEAATQYRDAKAFAERHKWTTRFLEARALIEDLTAR